MRTLKVMHFGKFYPPHRGGIETVLATLCRGLAERGVDCQAVVAGERGSPRVTEDRGVLVRRMRSFGTLDSLSICPEALWTLRATRADVVHLHHPNPLADVGRLFANPRTRLVVSYHSDIVRQRSLGRLHAPLLHSTLARADAIVASSAQYAASSPVLSRFHAKVRIIPYGLEPPTVEPHRPPFAGHGREPCYLFIGRLVPYKGLPVLLDALRAVPGRLWIAGSGPLERDLKRLAAETGLQGRVEFLGNISEQEKLRRLCACDAFVLPSATRAEAFGMVLLEAMAMRRPVVVSDLPTGVRMLVEDGVNGYRFPPGDSRALAGALQRLADDPARAREMGEEGRRHVRERWNADRMVEQYIELYRGLCGPGRSVTRPAKGEDR